MQTSVQDLYPDSFSHCYGCGRLNEHGLQIKSYLDGDEFICALVPQPYHLAVPGFVYGGLIASVIDCHSIGTAAASEMLENGGLAQGNVAPRYVTKSLHIDYRKPTPIEGTMEVRARVVKKGKKHRIVKALLFSDGDLRATGEVVAVPIPEPMLPAN